jgi:hypothetical protein
MGNFNLSTYNLANLEVKSLQQIFTLEVILQAISG